MRRRASSHVADDHDARDDAGRDDPRHRGVHEPGAGARQTVDKRADIWAFGCVLFEMLTGKRAFDGDDVSDTLAFVITKEPDFNLLPANIPAAVRTLLRRCFEKEPRRRLQAIGDARLEIDEALAASSSMTTSPGRPCKRSRPGIVRSVRPLLRHSPLWSLASQCGSGCAIVWCRHDKSCAFRSGWRARINSRQRIDASSRLHQTAPMLRLWRVRACNCARSISPMPEKSRAPKAANWFKGKTRFSLSDSKWIGFWQGNALKKVSVTGGAPVVICAARRVFGASWGANDRIVFGQGPAGISRRSLGWKPQTLVQVQPDQSAGWPEVLPDGRTLLFTLTTGNLWDRAQIVVQSLETGKRDVLFEGSDARYVPTGHLLYGLNESLMAVAFDVTESKVVGRPITLMRSVASSGTSGVVQASISRDGTLVYGQD